MLLREPDHGRRVEIKVGQQVDLVTGRVQEPFERRQAAAAPAAKPVAQEHGVAWGRARTARPMRDDKDDAH